MRWMRNHLTYANVLATLALFIALGGASYASLRIPANSVGPKQLKEPSVGPHQIRADSVGSRKLIDQSINPIDFAPGAVAPRLFAHVSSSGVLGESHGVESATRVSKGQYAVRFDRDLHGCVAVASVGFGFGPGVIGAGATAQPRMNLDNDQNKVGVTVYRKGYTFNDVEDNDVNVIVAC
jgi:hypothetical protein